MDVLNNLLNQLPKSHNELADMIYTVNMSPVFICIHYILVTLSMRKRAGSCEYAHHHPFASLFVCVTSCFGGNLVMNFLLGRPIILIYLNTTNVILASAVWYLIMFSPKDIVCSITDIKLVKAVVLSLKEVHRIRSILDGVTIASKLYADNVFVIVLIGSVRGSGAKFILRPLDCFVRGDIISDNEFLKPTFSTKHAVVSSILIHLVRTGVIAVDERLIVGALVIIAAIIQVMLLLTDIRDPYEKLEELFCTIFLRMPNELTKKDEKKKTD